MLAVGILPLVFIGFALYIIPESPRWLVMKNRVEEARIVLMKTVEDESEVEQRLQEIQQAAGTTNAEKYEEKPIWHELKSFSCSSPHADNWVWNSMFPADHRSRFETVKENNEEFKKAIVWSTWRLASMAL
ncbi:hypothetical protein NE237_009728 [Protea cynaroides]|uniref:Uncharacterized protein n=1 Tax=Protea cynaroides TaxID=273540 RepID=A0A9Q0KY74_9MAGN|nr:hypothetical protein NE237_009728 [Protea cynaroides]